MAFKCQCRPQWDAETKMKALTPLGRKSIGQHMHVRCVWQGSSVSAFRISTWRTVRLIQVMGHKVWFEEEPTPSHETLSRKHTPDLYLSDGWQVETRHQERKKMRLKTIWWEIFIYEAIQQVRTQQCLSANPGPDRAWQQPQEMSADTWCDYWWRGDEIENWNSHFCDLERFTSSPW